VKFPVPGLSILEENSLSTGAQGFNGCELLNFKLFLFMANAKKKYDGNAI
jgi:hypothetical protein